MSKYTKPQEPDLKKIAEEARLERFAAQARAWAKHKKPDYHEITEKKGETWARIISE
jgi:hypothetical protein